MEVIFPDERMDKPEDPNEPRRADTSEAKPRARGESVEDVDREREGLEREEDGTEREEDVESEVDDGDDDREGG